MPTQLCGRVYRAKWLNEASLEASRHAGGRPTHFRRSLARSQLQAIVAGRASGSHDVAVCGSCLALDQCDERDWRGNGPSATAIDVHRLAWLLDVRLFPQCNVLLASSHQITLCLDRYYIVNLLPLCGRRRYQSSFEHRNHTCTCRAF